MEIKHYATRQEAIEALAHERTASSDSATVYKLVKSKYQGYVVVAVEADLYADMLVGDIPAPAIINSLMPKYAG